jgi:hypothetical protein
MVDSKKEGSLLGFVNFSHEPNLKMVRLAVKGLAGYVWGFAVQSDSPLVEFTPLSVDYGTIFDDDKSPKECGCQSKLCQGFIGHLQFVDKHRFGRSSLSSLFSLLLPSLSCLLSLYFISLIFLHRSLRSWVLRVTGEYKKLSMNVLAFEEKTDTLAFPLQPTTKHITSVQLTAEPKESMIVATHMVTTETIKRGDVFSLNSDHLSEDSLATLCQCVIHEENKKKGWGQFLYGMFEGIVKKTKTGSYAIFSLLVAHDLNLSTQTPTPLTHYKNFQFAFPFKGDYVPSSPNNFFVHKVSSSLFLFYSFLSLITCPDASRC